MADETTNTNNESATVHVTTKNSIGKGTMIMIGAAILFLIIAAVLFSSFLSAPTGNSPANSSNSQSGTNR